MMKSKATLIKESNERIERYGKAMNVFLVLMVCSALVQVVALFMGH